MAQLSGTKSDMDLFESDIQDSYQSYVNKDTFEMTRMSIEMSEKSIKESERVRIRKYTDL